jgi:hypothetical protein
MKASLALALVAACLIGCEPQADEAASDAPKSAVMPSERDYPKGLLGLWKLPAGGSLELKEEGKALNTVVISGTQGVDVKPQVQEGSWGVSGGKLYLDLNSHVIAYDYTLKGSTLTMGKGKIKFDYKR